MAEKKPYLYLPDGWDDGYQAAKASAGISPLQVSIYGDSISAGAAGIGYDNAWSRRLARALGAEYGVWGDFWTNNWGWSCGKPWSSGLNATSMVYYNAEGLGPWWYTASTAANWYQRFTTPYACTAFDILWFDSYTAAATTWQYSLDGAGNQTVSNTAASQVKRLAFTNLANAVHTFDWGYQSLANSAVINGAAAYTGNAGGVAMAHFGASGTGYQDWPSACAGNLSGRNPQNGNSSPTYTTPGFGFPHGADLAIFFLLANDINSGYAVTAIQFNYDNMVQQIRRANPNCSILTILPCYPNWALDDVNSGFGNQGNRAQYFDAVTTAARRHNSAILDIHRKWGCSPYANGFMPNNDIHPTLAGQSDIYSDVAAILL